MIVAAVMSHPQASRRQIYEELSVARNTFYKALKTAKERGLQIGTNCLQIGTTSTNLSTPHLVRKLVVSRKGNQNPKCKDSSDEGGGGEIRSLAECRRSRWRILLHQLGAGVDG